MRALLSIGSRAATPDFIAPGTLVLYSEARYASTKFGGHFYLTLALGGLKANCEIPLRQLCCRCRDLPVCSDSNPPSRHLILYGQQGHSVMSFDSMPSVLFVNVPSVICVVAKSNNPQNLN